jgi:glutamate dehydrogenase (NADP+)
MLKRKGRSLEGLRVGVSGSGNVAQYAVEKAMALGAKVVTCSDSSGTVIDEEGFTEEKLADPDGVKNHLYGRVSDYAERSGARFEPACAPGMCRWTWPCPAPPRTNWTHRRRHPGQERRDRVAEGANMPTTLEAAKLFEHSGVLYAPGKASNAGGVATSGLEMSQNAMRLSWTREEVDARLQGDHAGIHAACLKHGRAPTAASATSTVPTSPAS